MEQTVAGWIKLHRAIFNNKYYRAQPFDKAHAWIDLLLLANHSEGYFEARGVPVNIKRGQVAWSMLSLSKRWKWSEWKVSAFLDALEAEGQITQEKSRFSVTLITILNYEEYQGEDAPEEKPSEDKPSRKRKPKSDEPSLNISFEDFWNLYDKKVGNCEKISAKWKALTDTERNAIMEYLPKYKQAKPDKQYRKNPETFLNNKSWNDELPGLPFTSTYKPYQPKPTDFF
jgi:hypothetical protein